MPSVLHIGADGAVLVGDAAERRAAADPSGVAREFKRRIGDRTPILLGDGGHTAHELTARLARWVVDLVRSREGGDPELISVTHPAGWGGHKTTLLGEALAEVGLGDALLLSEPAAAAIAYAASERIAPGEAVAVYDLGGGTVDTAVLRRDAIGMFELLGEPAGDDHFGGVDLDELLFERIRTQFPELLTGLPAEDTLVLSAVGRLRREITEAKEALSADTEAVIPVLLPSGQRQARLIRAEFEAMIRPALEETVDLMRRTIDSAGLTESDLAAVLLVGGSSRIPLVTELLSAGLGRPVAVDADPKATVAIGAALSASLDTVVEPAPAVVAPDLAGPPTRPIEPEIPLHLTTPSRPHRLLRPRVLLGAAGLALLAMTGGALVYSAETNDAVNPAQAATPDATPTSDQPPPGGGAGTVNHAASPKTSGHNAITSTSKASSTTTTSGPSTTTSSSSARSLGPQVGTSTSTTTADSTPTDTNTPPPPPPTTTVDPTTTTATQQPHQAPPPDTGTVVSSAPATSSSVITTTTDPTPTTV
ncbi:Hsp70 protein [Kutzneria buriramensis]|uniref:Hsp70 protein n=2 Tax=Kutzneria buriramensis TaxID=1045776 RepID=A0A3E0GZ92_9PSEU|nr:Hsp70 protein [Kutzneria buriramensis]